MTTINSLELLEPLAIEDSDLPAFLINTHRVANVAEAEAYVSRIAGLGLLIDALTAQSRERAEKGVMPPKWVYPYVISDIQNLLDASDNNPVLEDFGKKVAALGLDADKRLRKFIAIWESEGERRDRADRAGRTFGRPLRRAIDG